MADETAVDLGIAGLEDAVLIGRGGFATVFRAYQPAFSRTVAVKVVSVTQFDDRAKERFRRECQAMGLLSEHPSIVTVLEAGFLGDDRPFLVMAYMPEGSLQDRIAREGPLGWQDASRIGVKLAGALDTAHQAGVLHRDVKPANVLVSQYGEPQLADFGIARIAGGAETTSGVITASLSYAPPEVIEGRRPSVQADVYSLGATVFALASGSAPFWKSGDEGSVGALLKRLMTDPVPDLRQHGVPNEIAAVLETAMAKVPEERYETAAAFAQALRAAQHELGIRPTDLTLYAPPSKVTTEVAEPEPTVRDDGEPTETAVGAAPPSATATLSGAPTETVDAPARPGDATEETELVVPAREGRGRRLVGAGAILGALVLIVGGYAVLSSGDDEEPSPTTPTATTLAADGDTSVPVTTTVAAPRDPAAEAAFADGEFYLENDAFERAVEQYDRALAIDENVAEYHRQWGVAYYAWAWSDSWDTGYWGSGDAGISQRFAASQAAFSYATQLDPSDVDARIHLGRVTYDLDYNHRDRGVLAEVVLIADAVLEIDPNSWEAYQLKALAFGDLSRYEDAEVAASMALSVGETDPEWHDGTWIGVATGQWHDVAEMYEHAGLARMGLGDHAGALVWFDGCLAWRTDSGHSGAGHPGCLYKRAESHEILGNNVLAAADYRAYLDVAENDERAAHVNEFLAAAADWAAVEFEEAESSLWSGGYFAAILAYDTSIALDPTVADAYRGRAVARMGHLRSRGLLTQDAFDLALADIEYAQSLVAADWTYHFVEAELWHWRAVYGEWDPSAAPMFAARAVAAIATALDDQPDDWRLHALRGRALSWVDDNEPAAAALEIAVDRWTELPLVTPCCDVTLDETYNWLADRYYWLERWDDGAEAARRCSELADRWDCDFLWARHAREGGDVATAVAKYQKALDSGEMSDRDAFEAQVYINLNS